MGTVKVHDREVTIERFTMQKAMRVITLLGIVEKSIPEITKLAADYRREYREQNVIELDRAQARMEYGPRPVLDEEGAVAMREDGSVVTMPSPLDSLTDDDWERSGHKLRFNQSPSTAEVMLAVFPSVYEKAEQPVLRLLALVAMKNDDVSRTVRDGTIWDEVDRFAAEVIEPALLEEVMELAVAAGEQIEGQVMSKAKSLGARAGKLGKAFGLATDTPEQTEPVQPTSTTLSEQPEKPNTESSSVSLNATDGLTPTESLVSPGTPSITSAESLTATAP